MLYVNKKGGIVIKYTTISTYCSLVCLLCHLPSLKKMWYDMDKEKDVIRKDNKEEDTMTAIAIRKIDKTNSSGLTMEKKQILKSLQGIASSPIDFNKIRNEEKYGKDRL